MKKLLLIAALIAFTPVAFANDGYDFSGDFGGEMGQIEQDHKGGKHGGGQMGSGTYTCYETSGDFDYVCVCDSTGATLKFDHDEIVEENEMCHQIGNDTFKCSAGFERNFQD